jgi:ribosome-binding factor A
MKHRLERVRELIKRELSEVIARQLTFAGALVTVQHVDITPDLKQCHVYVSTLGGGTTRQEVITKLEEHRGALQHELSKRVILKYTPQLHFRFDDSIERGNRVIDIMQEIDPDSGRTSEK